MQYRSAHPLWNEMFCLKSSSEWSYKLHQACGYFSALLSNYALSFSKLLLNTFFVLKENPPEIKEAYLHHCGLCTYLHLTGMCDVLPVPLVPLWMTIGCLYFQSITDGLNVSKTSAVSGICDVYINTCVTIVTHTVIHYLFIFTGIDHTYQFGFRLSFSQNSLKCPKYAFEYLHSM